MKNKCNLKVQTYDGIHESYFAIMSAKYNGNKHHKKQLCRPKIKIIFFASFRFASSRFAALYVGVTVKANNSIHHYQSLGKICVAYKSFAAMSKG